MAGNMIKITDYDKVTPTKDDVLLINQNGSNRKTTVNDLVGDISTLGGKKLIEKVNENTTSLNENTQNITNHKNALVTDVDGVHGFKTEIGTWSPILTDSNGNLPSGYSIQTGSYIKIGKLVIVKGMIQISGTGTLIESDNIISGLPFSGDSDWSIGSCLIENITFPNGYTSACVTTVNTGARLRIYLMGSNVLRRAIQCSEITSSSIIRFEITYKIA